jgi:hypothetical protein
MPLSGAWETIDPGNDKRIPENGAECFEGCVQKRDRFGFRNLLISDLSMNTNTNTVA